MCWPVIEEKYANWDDFSKNYFKVISSEAARCSNHFFLNRSNLHIWQKSHKFHKTKFIIYSTTY
jgi:hypothetical protein